MSIRSNVSWEQEHAMFFSVLKLLIKWHSNFGLNSQKLQTYAESAKGLKLTAERYTCRVFVQKYVHVFLPVWSYANLILVYRNELLSFFLRTIIAYLFYVT